MKHNCIRFTLIFILLLFSVPGSSREKSPALSEKEVRVKRVKFINRLRRPASRQKKQRQIKTGQRLARLIRRAGKGKSGSYRIERYFDPKMKGFGADLFKIGRRVKFFHINHIHRILTGYLMSAFEYNRSDAAILSRFILYYNARHRGDIATVKSKYSGKVVSALNPKKIGIARSYRKWAGNTQILLPLEKNIVRPGKADIDSSEIKKNVGKVTKEEKKKINKLREKRRDEDRKRLKKLDKVIKKEKKKIEKRKKDIKKAIKKKETRIKELKKDPEKNKGIIKKEEKEKTKLKKEEKRIEKEEKKIKQKEKDVTEKREKDIKEAAKDKKEAEATSGDTGTTTRVEKKKLKETLRKEIKEEQEEKSKNVIADKILFLRVLRYFPGGHYRNELWAIDAANDDTLFKGPYTNICGRTFVVLEESGILVIGYTGTSHSDSAHNLVLLDSKTLGQKKSSKETIFWRSPMLLRDGKIYAIEMFQSQYYLSRFNTDLSLDARSSEPISSDSDITFYKGKIYLTGKGAGGKLTNIRILQRSDLKHLKTIVPGG